MGPATTHREKFARLPLFAGLADAALDAIDAELEWLCLPGGSTLFHAGDEGDALYIVTAGGLGVITVGGDDGPERQVARVSAGDVVGEIALVAGVPRTATVVAHRDTELLRLDRAAFERLVERHPAAMLELIRRALRRLRRALSGAVHRDSPKTFCLLPVSADVPAAALARDLTDAVGTAGLRAGLMTVAASSQTTGWFHAVEMAHDVVLYLAEPVMSPWTRLCLRQADRILFLAMPDSPPAPGLRLDLAVGELGRRPRDLVLLQDADAPWPRAAAPWLRRVEVDLHCHVRLGRRDDLGRLVRLMTGRAVGLVLSGGGARGFAHLGVVRALREAGVPLDLVAGTSMGAIVGAAVALEYDHAAFMERMRRAFVETNPLSDYTLPLIALVKGRRVTRLLREQFGETKLEDTWRPYLCMSSNLTTGQPHVHRAGPLWRALRASVAIPGVLPPVIEDGEVLVDGGVINNLPVDVMGGLGRGPLIGIDVAADRALTLAPEELEGGALGRLIRHPRSAPAIVGLLVRAGTVSSEIHSRTCRRQVDLLLEPPLEAIDILNWHAFDRAVDLGYRYAAATLERLDAPPWATPSAAPPSRPRAGGEPAA